MAGRSRWTWCAGAYSLYIWHASVGRVAQAAVPALGISSPGLTLLLVYAAAIGWAVAMFLLVERPAMRLRETLLNGPSLRLAGRSLARS